MRTIILKVVEGKGKTGNAKTGSKRFLFTEDSISVFNSFVADFTNRYKEKYPQGKQTYKTLRKQWLDVILKYQDSDVMEWEVKELNTTLRVGNLTKLIRVPYLDIDKTLSQKLI